MTDAQTEFQAALKVARDAKARYEGDSSKDNFRIWRDAAEVAIKWHRAIRLEGSAEEDAEEDPLDELAARRAARA